MRKKINGKIDFVIPWVDGNDPDWIKEYNKYVSTDKTIDNSNFRFRDWDNFQYWFRSIEKYTPWVNKIHFVTWGHIPKWLNINHPKINIVNHKDYIPKEYLPTFNSRVLEIHLHRIKDLSKNFVYFNDDTFILKPTELTRFFKNELPCDSAIETVLLSTGIAHIKLNNILVINKFFSKRKQFFNNFSKWINIKYGLKNNLRNLILMSYNGYSTLLNHHMPVSYKKNTLYEVWKKNKNTLDFTSKSRFRKISDVNQYIFRYWQLVTGDFTPISMKDCKNMNIFDGEDSDKKDKIDKTDTAYEIIKNQKYRMICINDGYASEDTFNKSKNRINEAFESILPEKSSFELD